MIEPRGGGVGRKAELSHLTLPLRSCRSIGVQKRSRLVRCQRVGYISKVQAAHQFRWAHVDQQLPNCFTLELCPQVPHAIVPDGTSVGNFQLSRKYRAGRKRQASDCENGLELPKFLLTKFVKTSLTGSLLAGTDEIREAHNPAQGAL